MSETTTQKARRWVSWALTGVAVLMAADLSAGTIVTVPGDYATIQEAVDAVQDDADPGEVVVESDGVFDETVLIQQSVTLRAGAGFTPTIERIGTVSGPLRVFATENDDTHVVVMGLTLRYVDGSSVVFVSNGSDLEPLDVRLLEVTIEGQTVDQGVVVASGDGDVELTMLESSVEIVGDSSGSPVCLRLEPAGFDLTVLLGANTFRFSRAGGVRLRGGFDDDQMSALLLSNVFESFDSGGFSGRTGVEIGGLNNAMGDFSSAAVTLASNLFVGAAEGIGVSAARQHEIDLIANNNTIVDAAFFGIRVAASQRATVTARLANNVVAGTQPASTGAPEGGGVEGVGVFGSIFGTEATVDLVIGHNLLFDNAGGDYGGIAMPGPGDVFADPRFVAPEQGDYHLGLGSPAIDAGDDQPPGGTSELDLDLGPRFVDGDRDGTPTVDIGAYEAPEAALLEVPTLSTAALVCFAALLAAAAAWRLRGPASTREDPGARAG